ncbi:hypothetical protein Tco_1399536 [Tanacetum coccineum]
MVVCEWHLHIYDEEVNEEHAYHSSWGYLSDSPNRKYKDDTFNYFDQVDIDLFSIVDLNDMLEILELRNDQDVLNLINHTTKYKLIEIYCVHEDTDLEVVFVERTPKKSYRDLVKKRTSMKRNDETRNKNYVDMENNEDSDIAKDIYIDMEVSSDSEDSEWIDEEHIMNEVEVDMKDFYEHTDKDVEWIRCCKGNNEIPIEHTVAESYDLDDFDSASGRMTRRELELFIEVKQKSLQKHGSSPSLKNIEGKWVKVTSPQKQGSTPTAKASGSTLNKTCVKSIKVRGTKGHYIYEDITCP